jgi:mono/diheme cytochrome c family protein
MFARDDNQSASAAPTLFAGSAQHKLATMQQKGKLVINLPLPEVRAACLIIGILGAMIASLVERASAQVALPDGPNRDLVESKCGNCHTIEMVVINGRSEDKWNVTIDEMIGYGLQLSPAERALVLEYLTTYLPPPK